MSIKNLDNLPNSQNFAILNLDKNGSRLDHLPIPPYPFTCERYISLKDGTILHIRPIRADDNSIFRWFLNNLSKESLYSRFGQFRINLTNDYLSRLCQIDYDQDHVFLAILGKDGEKIVGEAQLNVFHDPKSAELSFVVADQWQGRGIGNLLMDFCLQIAKEIGLKTLLMWVMKSNVRMRQFGYKYGFQTMPGNRKDDMEEMQLNLSQTLESLYSYHH